jgi:hypothetical protein
MDRFPVIPPVRSTSLRRARVPSGAHRQGEVVVPALCRPGHPLGRHVLREWSELRGRSKPGPVPGRARGPEARLPDHARVRHFRRDPVIMDEPGLNSTRSLAGPWGKISSRPIGTSLCPWATRRSRSRCNSGKLWPQNWSSSLRASIARSRDTQRQRAAPATVSGECNSPKPTRGQRL